MRRYKGESTVSVVYHKIIQLQDEAKFYWEFFSYGDICWSTAVVDTSDGIPKTVYMNMGNTTVNGKGGILLSSNCLSRCNIT
jgi:hypothetical protein